ARIVMGDRWRHRLGLLPHLHDTDPMRVVPRRLAARIEHLAADLVHHVLEPPLDEMIARGQSSAEALLRDPSTAVLFCEDRFETGNVVPGLRSILDGVEPRCLPLGNVLVQAPGILLVWQPIQMALML